MNKIKPQAGQVWRRRRYPGESWSVSRMLKYYSGHIVQIKSLNDPLHAEVKVFLCDDFIEWFEFIPQNDLEWLAVNDVKIPEGEKFAYYSNHIDRVVKFSQTIFKNGKTQDEIQNMRYKLGLDEKPRITAKEWARMLRDKQ